MNRPASDPAPRLCLLLFMAVAAWFLPSLPFGLTNWDDDFYIEMNPYLRAGIPGNVWRAFGESYFGNYHPLTMVSYAVDYAVGGMSPAVFRAQNILWHAGACVLLALLLRRFGAGEAAFLLALAWGIHPLRNENVIWLSERKDVLSAFFLLAALMARTSPQDETGSPRRRARCLALECACLIAALLSKPIAIVYAPLALAHDALLSPARLRRELPAHAFFWVVCVAFALVNLAAQDGNPLPPELTTPWARAKGVLLSCGWYPIKTLLPTGLSPLHPRASTPEPASLPFVACAAVAAALFGLGLTTWRRRPAIAFGIAAYFIALGPVSGIVPDGAAFVADRYAYLPTVGLLIAASAALASAPERARLAAATALIVPILASGPLARMEVWRTSRTLWLRVLEVYPDFATAKVKLAQEDMERGVRIAATPDIGQELGRDSLALEVAQRAALREGRLDDARAAVNALPAGAARSRGALLMAAQARDAALAKVAARELMASGDRSREDAGLAVCKLVEAGALDEALSLARAHYRPISLTMAHGQGMLARALIREGRPGDALALLVRAGAVNPEDPEAILGIVEHAVATGEPARAAAWLRSVSSRSGLPSETRDALEAASGAFHRRFSAQQP